MNLETICKDIRIGIIERSYMAGKNCAHVGGSLSAVEVMAVLFHQVINRPEDLGQRDRFVLSKGHASLALYCTLESVGLLTKEEVDTFEQNGSHYTAHAKKDILKGIEFSGGSLGLGTSYAVGVAHALKMKGSSARVFTVLGDGECNEGIVWESLMYAKHQNLDNLVVIVDHNHLQADGPTEIVMNTFSLADKLTAFGFYTQEVNGHSTDELTKAFANLKEGTPNAIVAETVKGKGVKFMEGKTNWHFASLPESKYNKAITELKDNGKA
ncbi:MAG: transketolase [Bacteroidales bacterium]|nr:transketolase [Bacteroidales bacterium]